MKKINVFLLVLFLANAIYGQHTTVSNVEPKFIEDKGFWQEYHEAYPVSEVAIENNVRSIAVDKNLTVWIATSAGIFMKKRWRNEMDCNTFQGCRQRTCLLRSC